MGKEYDFNKALMICVKGLLDCAPPLWKIYAKDLKERGLDPKYYSDRKLWDKLINYITDNRNGELSKEINAEFPGLSIKEFLGSPITSKTIGDIITNKTLTIQQATADWILRFYQQDFSYWDFKVYPTTNASSKIKMFFAPNSNDNDIPEESKIKGGKLPIKIGLPKYQDTILLRLFERSYERNFKVEFVQFNNWEDCMKAFKEKRINIALHSFHSAIALSIVQELDIPMFFFPYFYFIGYGVFIKQTAINAYSKKHGIRFTDFEKFNKNQKIDFFQKSKIIVEGKTDLEWALRTYLENLGCDLSIMKDNIILLHDTNNGKKEFIKNPKYAVYCSNGIHIRDLQRKEFKDAFVLVAEKNSVVDHRNFNGIICTYEYYAANKSKIDELKNIWFDDIKFFQKKIGEIIQNEKFKKPLDRTSIISGLKHILNEETKSLIDEFDLPHVYMDYNHFYEDVDEAFNDFYQQALYEDDVISNYAGIVELQLDLLNSREEIKSLIISQRERMTDPNQ